MAGLSSLILTIIMGAYGIWLLFFPIIICKKLDQIVKLMEEKWEHEQ